MNDKQQLELLRLELSLERAERQWETERLKYMRWRRWKMPAEPHPSDAWRSLAAWAPLALAAFVMAWAQYERFTLWFVCGALILASAIAYGAWGRRRLAELRASMNKAREQFEERRDQLTTRIEEVKVGIGV